MDEYFVEEKSAYEKLLDILVFVAVFVVTILLIGELFELNTGVEEYYLWISFGVLAIFAADLVRLRNKADSWSDFFHHSWLDILATIPFELLAIWLASIPPGTAGAFGILKYSRLTRLSAAARVSQISRISKVSKEFKAAAHLKEEGEKFKKKNRV